jgi:hypothetical protein
MRRPAVTMPAPSESATTNVLEVSQEVAAAAMTLVSWFVAALVERGEKPPPADDFVTAKTSGLGAKVFRAAARRREFPVYLVGKTHVAKRRDVIAFIERQKVTQFGKSAPSDGAADEFDRALAKGRLRAVGTR